MIMRKLYEITLALLLLLFVGFIAFYPGDFGMVGLIIYETREKTANWTFDNANDYIYDSSLINSSNGEVKLVRSVVGYSLITKNNEELYITSAVEYEPGKKIHDRTSKIQSLDGDGVNIKKDKDIFDVTFDKELGNNDIISMYIIKSDDDDDEDDDSNGSQPIDIYLCANGTSCDKPGYGLASFNGNEGWHNITIAGLNAPRNIFNLKPSKNIELDYIKAVHKESIINNFTNVSYPKSASIETKDFAAAGVYSFLNFYRNELADGQSVKYYYSVDSGTNWNIMPLNSNISGVSADTGKIRIKADLSGSGTETPVIYDFAVSYSTKICNENWNLAYGECLSNNKILKYYVDKSGCETIANLPADNGTYESCIYTEPCNEDWNLTYGACLPNDTKLKYYVDKTGCGTANSIPSGNGTYIACDYCSPSWTCISYGECLLNNFKRCKLAEDSNSCYKLTNLSSDAYSGNYNEFDLNCVYNRTGAGFSNLSISPVANEKLTIDRANSTDAVIELNASNSLENNFISMIKYSDNKKNTSPSLSALNKYLDIEANSSLKNSINSAKIKIYYTDEEINNAGIDEGSLKIYYFNETSNQWQELNSIVNATGNYVEVTIGHLSTFGIFGEQKQSSSSSGSSAGSGSGGSGGGGGGGGGSTRRISSNTATKTMDTVLPNKDAIPAGGIAIKEEKIETDESQIGGDCNYKVSTSIPEHISFVESDIATGIIHNIGSCTIESLNINFESSSLASMLDINPKFIRNLDVNQSAEMFLIKKIEPEANILIQGLGIKLPAESVSTYDGSVIVGAVIGGKIAFEEKINVKIDVLETPLITKIIGSKAAFLILILAILAAFLVFAYKMHRKKKSNPPMHL